MIKKYVKRFSSAVNETQRKRTWNSISYTKDWQEIKSNNINIKELAENQKSNNVNIEGYVGKQAP